MSRHRLPDRRPSETVTIESRHQGGKRVHVTKGFYPADMRVGEAFAHGLASGSHTEMMVAESMTLLSICLQNGETLESLSSVVHREPDGSPCTTFGECFEALMNGSST